MDGICTGRKFLTLEIWKFSVKRQVHRKVYKNENNEKECNGKKNKTTGGRGGWNEGGDGSGKRYRRDCHP